MDYAANELEKVAKTVDEQIDLEHMPKDYVNKFNIKDPILDIIPLFKKSYCNLFDYINNDKTSNFAGMNFEYLFQKDAKLVELEERIGTLENMIIPEN